MDDGGGKVSVGFLFLESRQGNLGYKLDGVDLAWSVLMMVERLV